MIDIIIAILVYQIIGFIWYSDTLFGTYWKKQTKIKKSPVGFVFILSAIFSIGIVVALSVFVSQQTTILGAIAVALALSTALTLLPMTINAMYEQKPATLVLITAGYHMIAILIAAIILAL